MTEDGRDRRAPGQPPRGGRRGPSASEERPRTLGKQTQASGARVGSLLGTSRSGNSTVSSVPNQSGLRSLGEEMYRSNPGRRPRRRSGTEGKRRHRVLRVAVVGFSVLLVLAVAGAGYVYYVTHDLNRVNVKGLNGALTSGQEAGTENILMVGSTSRCALAVQNPAYGLCSQGVNGVNSDVIMILHADPAHHRLALLSIPRDLFVPNARSAGANKVDAGLVDGISQVVAAIEEDFGIPIQHAVSLNFDQFANIVNALGGINMSFPMSVFDAESGLNVRAATCVHLDGTQALQVVRARHLQYDEPGSGTDAEYWPQEVQSDLARIRRDHEFLRVLATAVAKKGIGNPITDLNLINSVKDDLTFDQSWSVSDMADLVLDFHSVDINSVPQLTLPVAEVNDPDGPDGDLIYQGGNYGDVEFTSQVQDQSAIDEVLGIGPTTDSMTGDPLPNASSVTVSVMNGTGVADQAANTASALSALGFDTVGVGDATPVGDVAETVVYYGSRTPAVEAAAEKVVRSMSGSVIMAYDPSQVTSGAQVTVVTGTQFAVDAPATPATGSSATTSPAGATTSPPASATISAPSAASTSLQPWDPRACPAGATPTAPVPNPT
jgi:LCP family protein required for cell wall assembly